jgi:hypothetical protein
MYLRRTGEDLLSTLNGQQQQQQEVTFKLVNQAWFKVLALISFACAVTIYAALIWLLVCRAHRLPETDEAIKKAALAEEKLRRMTKRSKQRRQMSLKRKLRFLMFGNRKLIPPEEEDETTSCMDEVSSNSNEPFQHGETTANSFQVSSAEQRRETELNTKKSEKSEADQKKKKRIFFSRN